MKNQLEFREEAKVMVGRVLELLEGNEVVSCKLSTHPVRKAVAVDPSEGEPAITLYDNVGATIELEITVAYPRPLPLP